MTILNSPGFCESVGLSSPVLDRVSEVSLLCSGISVPGGGFEFSVLELSSRMKVG